MNKNININTRNISFSVILTDITMLKVDAIVNAAHEMLMGGGGVDGAIHKTAGPELLNECRQIPIKNGIRCKTGQVKITKAYNLPSKYIIHTVAPKFVGGLIRRIINGKSTPIFKNNYPERDIELADCYKNTIIIANEYKLHSIAFPSLGTGGHAYPIELACPIALSACKNTLETMLNTHSIHEITFVCFSKKDYDFYEENLGNL